MKYTPVPKEMFEPCDQPGTLERFHYASRGKRKDALVYLPWGYQDSTEEYPVLYLMHGGGGDANEFFGGLEARTGLKNLLDNAIARGYAHSMIVVTPTYMVEGVEGARRQIGEALQLTHRFPREFRDDLLPAIHQRYRAADDRRMRAFGGFSMGGETTWSLFAQAADLVPNLLLSVVMCAAVTLVGRLELGTFVALVLQIVTGVAVYVLLSVITRNESFRYLLKLLKSRGK